MLYVRLCCLLEHEKYLFLDLLRNLYPSCLQTVYPCVNLFGSHSVKNVSEFFGIIFGVLFGLDTLEPVQFLVVEVEIAVIISFGTVGVLAAANSIFRPVVVVVVNGRLVAVESLKYEKTCNYKQ